MGAGRLFWKMFCLSLHNEFAESRNKNLSRQERRQLRAQRTEIYGRELQRAHQTGTKTKQTKERVYQQETKQQEKEIQKKPNNKITIIRTGGKKDE